MQRLLLLITCFSSLTGNAQCNCKPAPVYEAFVQKTPVFIGNNLLQIVTSTYTPDTGKVFIQLHHNETTSKKAITDIMEQSGGVLVHIENNEQRNVTFTGQCRQYTFDPNRVFTQQGIKATLGSFNSHTPYAAKNVQKFAQAYLAQLPPTATVIALHNNTDSNFSILSYINDPVYKADAKSVYRAADKDIDDFFLTTNDTLFYALKAKGYNIILQNNEQATDDGSLSVYYGKKGLLYINVEAEHGHLAEQKEMIQALLDVLNAQTLPLTNNSVQ